MKVYYSVEEICTESVYAAEIFGRSIDRWAAQECAEDYHDSHDGWELQSWPYTFALRQTEDGPVIARFIVDCESVPSFSAITLKA